MNKVKLNRYNYALSPTSQFYFCGVPFRLDVSPNCPLDCSYCFSFYNAARRTSLPVLADPERLERKLEAIFERGKINGDINAELLARRQPLHFGGLTDPFFNAESTDITIRILKALNRFHYPVIISTKKADCIIRDKALRALTEMKFLSVQISIASPDDKRAMVVEPGVPLVSERINAAAVLTGEGIHCSIRLQPLFFPWLQQTEKSLIPELFHAGCRHVIVEFLKIPYVGGQKRFNQLFENIKWDGFTFYRKAGAVVIGREIILPPHFKWEMLQPIIAKIHAVGMTYGSGDYGLNHMGDTECCCGIDGLPGFSNWARANFAQIIRNAKTDALTFSLVENEYIPSGSIKRYINSHSRIEGDNSFSTLLLKKWNHPGSPNAPDSFYGVESTGESDHKGNVIYRIIKKRQ